MSLYREKWRYLGGHSKAQDLVFDENGLPSLEFEPTYRENPYIVGGKIVVVDESEQDRNYLKIIDKIEYPKGRRIITALSNDLRGACVSNDFKTVILVGKNLVEVRDLPSGDLLNEVGIDGGYIFSGCAIDNLASRALIFEGHGNVYELQLDEANNFSNNFRIPSYYPIQAFFSDDGNFSLLRVVDSVKFAVDMSELGTPSVESYYEIDFTSGEVKEFDERMSWKDIIVGSKGRYSNNLNRKQPYEFSSNKVHFLREDGGKFFVDLSYLGGVYKNSIYIDPLDIGDIFLSSNSDLLVRKSNLNDLDVYNIQSKSKIFSYSSKSGYVRYLGSSSGSQHIAWLEGNKVIVSPVRQFDGISIVEHFRSLNLPPIEKGEVDDSLYKVLTD